MRIVLTEPLGVPAALIDSLSAPLKAAGHDFVQYDTVASDQDELLRRAKDADILIIANHPLPDEVILRCKKLQHISVAFAGVDHVGSAAFQQKELSVSNAAGYCSDAVAELTLGLAIDCLRRITVLDAATRRGGTREGVTGHELRGKRVGILGAGRIGMRTAELFHAFGCPLYGMNRHGNHPKAAAIGMTFPQTMEAFLSCCDILSIHTPLTEQTIGLIGSAELALLPKGAILINTARGPVVDSAALATALASGQLSAAATDVFESEPPLSGNHPLLSAENLILTPHIAFCTEESMLRRAQIAFENVLSFLSGAPQNSAF